MYLMYVLNSQDASIAPWNVQSFIWTHPVIWSKTSIDQTEAKSDEAK